MYVPTWVICVLCVLGGALLTFLGMVVAVIIQNSRKKGE